MRDLIGRQRVQLGLDDAVDGAGHQRADRLGGAPLAMVAVGERCIRLLRLGDGAGQFILKLPDAGAGRGPAPDVGRLHDDQFDLGRTEEGPLRFRRTHRRRSVEEKLRVLLDLDSHAVAKLPIQNNRSITNAAKKVGRTKHTRQKITKANPAFNRIFHLPVGVDLFQCRQRGQQLGLNQILCQHRALMLATKIALGRTLVVQNVGNGVVEQRAFIGVAAAGLRRHLGHQRHAAGAGDDALGGRAADDLTVLHTVPHCIVGAASIRVKKLNARALSKKFCEGTAGA